MMDMTQIEFRCDLSEKTAPFPHFWEHTVGSGHAPLASRADWQAHMRRCHEELGFRYVRFHALLSDHMGTLVRHHEKLGYSFFNADQILDFLLSIGMKPFVELSFMPKALASGDTTVFDYEANVTPPRDYAEWGALVSRHPVRTEQVRITLTGVSEPGAAYVERIDEAHANAKRLWLTLGEPEYPSGAEVERLRDASLVRREPYAYERVNGGLTLDIALPPHAVAAITLAFAPDSGQHGS